ncbi:MAG: PCRF domain-containing protein, partial [Actinomycetota bacterium]
MFDRVQSLEDEFVSLEASLSDPGLASDQAKMRDVTRRYKDLTPVVDCIRRRRALSADADAARELLAVATEDERVLLREELRETEDRLAALEDEL